jgi:hypothetical protein
MLFMLFYLVIYASPLQLYNPGSTSYLNSTWMGALDYGIKIR